MRSCRFGVAPTSPRSIPQTGQHFRRFSVSSLAKVQSDSRVILVWRFDPASAARLPQASYDAHVIVFCSESYTSSLAEAALQDLGVRNATDLEGGFVAWQAAGLPVAAAGPGAGAAG